jgi:hypothetical protein
MSISKLTIEHKNQSLSKITITAAAEVRIKMEKDLTSEQETNVLYKFYAVSRAIIDSGIHHKGTLRGKYEFPKEGELEPKIMYLETNSTNKQNSDKYRVYLDTFEIVYIGKHA